MFILTRMVVRPARTRSLALLLVCSSTLVVLAWACNFGLDVDDLTRCPECLDDARSSADGPFTPPADGRPDSAVDAGTDADAPRCALDRGGAMVLGAEAGPCIDRSEVTNEQYAGFLASGFRFDGGAADPCDPAGSYVPSANWPPAAADNSLPVTHVTWCAARAFCGWAGKRLCGARSSAGAGGPLDVTQLGRPEFDEWTAVCSQDGKVAYVYGNDFIEAACNGDAFNVRRPIAVGSLPSCAPSPGGAPRDLSGNVWEWIDSCESSGFCYAHGGAFNSPAPELDCTARLRLGRDAGLDTVGIRCCSR